MTIPHTFREMEDRAYLDAVVDGVYRLICQPCAKAHGVEDRFKASNLRTFSSSGEGGCNLCAQDVPLHEVRIPLSVVWAIKAEEGKP
jgi:hypothetical protein